MYCEGESVVLDIRNQLEGYDENDECVDTKYSINDDNISLKEKNKAVMEAYAQYGDGTCSYG